MKVVVSFMSDEVVGGWGEWWQACCWQQWHREVSTPTVDYCMFTETDVDHMLRGRRRLLDFSLWSLTCSVAHCIGWHLSQFMNFITSASFITADSDPIWSTWIGHDPIPIR